MAECSEASWASWDKPRPELSIAPAFAGGIRLDATEASFAFSSASMLDSRYREPTRARSWDHGS